MRIYNPIFPSIKNRLDELFGDPPTSIVLESYDGSYSILDQDGYDIIGRVYPQDAISLAVTVSYIPPSEGGTLTFSITYGEDDQGQYFKVHTSASAEGTYTIEIRSIVDQSVRASFVLNVVNSISE